MVRYWRTYLREAAEGERSGLYPLDEELGLTGDWVSFGLLVVAARLALKLSFAEALSTLGLFVPSPRSTEVIEQTVLSLGQHTAAWFESAPAPSGDGDALVIQIDSKAMRNVLTRLRTASNGAPSTRAEARSLPITRSGALPRAEPRRLARGIDGREVAEYPTFRTSRTRFLTNFRGG